jgi:Tat protein translocase TatB subunit
VSGPSFWEFLLLCMIGLIVLGPKRLPQVANQIGTWIGHARRMTRTLKRQLEEELELNKPLNVRPSIRHTPPRDDDGFSPVHEPSLSAGAATDLAEPRAAGEAVPHEGVPDEHLSDDRVPDTNSEAVMPGSDREPRREA